MAPYEIDFLPVGDGERSGDAISLRYDLGNGMVIHVVDGGTQDSGKALCDHIDSYYDKPKMIHHVVLTHPDDDHSSGLREVIQRFQIGSLWMNRPWKYAAELVDSFKDARWTAESLVKRLRKDYPILAELEETAIKRGIPINDAFQGAQIGAFRVMAPTKKRYLQIVPLFSRTPQPAADKAAGTASIKGILAELAKSTISWIKETWNVETLEEGGTTSESNESSVVQLASIDGKRLLLTGDAGVISLNEAADYAALAGVALPGLRFMQIPHHGSRHNVSPSLLNRWIGAPVQSGQKRDLTAYASAAKNDPNHPRKKVTNAFLRRGAFVLSTKGEPIRHQHDMPDRKGWTAATSMLFSDNVES